MAIAKPLIVWVDDTAENLFSQVWGIENAGYRVLPVSEPEKALAIIKEKQPVLALLDVVMPHPGGYELCRQLQADPATSCIPVILLSLLDGRKNMDEAFAAGAVDYLLKPLDSAAALPVLDIRLKTHALWLEVNRGHYSQQADSQVAAFVSYAHNRIAGQVVCPVAQNYRRDNLYEVLCAGGVPEDRAARQIAEFFRLPYLHRFEKEDVSTRAFTREFSLKNSVLGFRARSGEPSFAVSNPLNKELLRRIRREAGSGGVSISIVPPSAIAAALAG